MRTYSIYIIRNSINNKVYIGQTCHTLKLRFSQHMKPSVMKERGRYKLYNAIKKHGKDKFYIELLEDNISESDIDCKEIWYIEKFNSYEQGYNSTRGGDSRTISKVDDIETLVEMFNSGMTYIDIANEFDVSKETIVRTLKALNLKRNKRVDKQFLLDNISKTNKELAEMLSVHPETIGRAFSRYEIPRGKGCNNHLNKQNQKRKV